jgi:hypothetical protein
LQVTTVNMQTRSPKKRSGLHDAIKAREDNSAPQNEAGPRDDVLPGARLRQDSSEANACKAQVVAEAEGGPAVSCKCWPSTEGPQVTRGTSLPGTLESVLGSSRPIVVDIQKGGNNLFVLPLDRMLSGRVAQEDTTTPASGSTAASPPAPSRIDLRNADRLRSRSERNGSE